MKTKLRTAIVMGTRPNLVKYYPFFIDSELFEPADLIYTGQHYDKNMRDSFFEGLNIPEPTIDLSLTKPGEMLDRLIEVLQGYNLVIVYGDTHSSLMGALAGSYLGIPVAHIEAGVRSDNMRMPEEINRRCIDAISMIKLCPSKNAYDNLYAEGNSKGAFIVGDVMLDTLGRFLPMGRSKKRSHYLLTLHRPSNVDDKEKLHKILKELGRIDGDVLFPVHPRTRKNLDIDLIPDNVHLSNPVSYMKMIDLIYDAKKVITDSGGVQKEAFWLTTPCLTLRDETEWTETLQSGWNILVNPDNLVDHIKEEFLLQQQIQPYGGGDANNHITKVLTNHYEQIKNY